jgi:hypothetical protein
MSMVLGGEALGVMRKALINGISALIKQLGELPHLTSPTMPSCNDSIRQMSMNQEVRASPCL